MTTLSGRALTRLFPSRLEIRFVALLRLVTFTTSLSHAGSGIDAAHGELPKGPVSTTGASSAASRSTTGRNCAEFGWSSACWNAHENGPIEAFNGRLRAECPNENWFLSPADVKEKFASWRWHYNAERLDSALARLAPEELSNWHSLRDNRITPIPDHSPVSSPQSM